MRASGGKPFVKTYVNRERFTLRVCFANIRLERKLSIRIVDKNSHFTIENGGVSPFSRTELVKIIPFLKVFEIPKDFFQKVLWWGAGAKPRIAYPRQIKI